MMEDSNDDENGMTLEWERNNGLLINAVINRNLPRVKELLEKGVDVSYLDGYGNRAIDYACSRGYLDIAILLVVKAQRNNGQNERQFIDAVINKNLPRVKELLKKGVDVNYVWGNGIRAIDHARSRAYLDIAKLLKENGAFPFLCFFERNNGQNRCQLLSDVLGGNLPRVKELLEKVVDVSYLDGLDNREIDYACARGSVTSVYLDIVKLSVENGATEEDVRAKYGLTLLLCACLQNHLEVVKFLIEKGADIHANYSTHSSCIHGETFTPLHEALNGGHLEIAKLLIENGADINSKNKSGEDHANYSTHCSCIHGFTPLHRAVNGGHLQFLAKLLIENGAEINSKKKSGEDTPLRHYHPAPTLHFACKQRLGLEVLKFLVENGAEVNRKDDRGWTPLLWAYSIEVERNFYSEISWETAKWLIENGADVNVNYDDGKTLLHDACWRDLDEIAEFMMEKGADIHAKDFDGKTPLHLACEIGSGSRLALFLVIDSADTNAKDNSGKTPFHYACWKGDKIIVNEMIVVDAADVEGPDINAKDDDGKTPLHLACECGHLKVVQLLLGQGANVAAETTEGSTPLHVASEGNHLEVVWLLVRQNPWLVCD